MKKTIILSLIALSLSGCSKGNDLSYSKDAYNNADMTFVGIPTILGLGVIGSTFPITPNYSLTAKHVAKYSFNSVLAYHPNCDIAIIKHNNKGRYIPELNQTYFNEDIKNYGYSFISALPVSSSGIVKKRLLMLSSYNDKECPVMFSNSGVVSGMSGGPVYNTKNQIIGVNVASQSGYTEVLNNKKQSFTGKEGEGLLFVNIGDIKGWMIEEINKTEDNGKLKFAF
jgi:hypothetical protein